MEGKLPETLHMRLDSFPHLKFHFYVGGGRKSSDQFDKIMIITVITYMFG